MQSKQFYSGFVTTMRFAVEAILFCSCHCEAHRAEAIHKTKLTASLKQGGRHDKLKKYS